MEGFMDQKFWLLTLKKVEIHAFHIPFCSWNNKIVTYLKQIKQLLVISIILNVIRVFKLLHLVFHKFSIAKL
jgi:hypothetical protein